MDLLVEYNISQYEEATSHSFNTTIQVGYERSLAYKIIVPILFGLITLLGAVGNSLVIYVIIGDRKMRTVTNILLLNLAFADLSFVLICPPFTAQQFVSWYWPFGAVMCKLMHYLLNVTAYVTVYTLVLISAIRYMTIVHSAHSAHLRTKQRVVVMIAAIWVIVLLLNIPILTAYAVTTNEDGLHDCDNTGNNVGQRIFSTFFAFAYIIPLSIIAILSILILHHIERHRPPQSTNKRISKTADKKRQASRLLISVVVIFAILWLPVHIHLLVAYFGTLPQSQFYHYISVLWNCLAYFNSCANPIIYNFASHEFRDGFRAALRCDRLPSRDTMFTARQSCRSSAYPSAGNSGVRTAVCGGANGELQLPELNKVLVSPDTDITSDERISFQQEPDKVSLTTSFAV